MEDWAEEWLRLERATKALHDALVAEKWDIAVNIILQIRAAAHNLQHYAAHREGEPWRG